MSAPNDGGPAFPVISTTLERKTDPGSNSEHFIGDVRSSGGMSLRDWFAGQALDDDIAELTPKTMGDYEAFKKRHGFEWNRAWARYQHADAMLAERAKTK